MVQSSRAIDKECGSNNGHLQSRTVAWLSQIYFKVTSYIFLSLFQFLCQTNINSIDRIIKISKVLSQYNVKLAISFKIPLPGMIPSYARMYAGIYSILLTLNNRSGCMKEFSPKTHLLNLNKIHCNGGLSPLLCQRF